MSHYPPRDGFREVRLALPRDDRAEPPDPLPLGDREVYQALWSVLDALPDEDRRALLALARAFELVDPRLRGHAARQAAALLELAAAADVPAYLRRLGER